MVCAFLRWLFFWITWVGPWVSTVAIASLPKGSELWHSPVTAFMYEKPILNCHETSKRLQFFYEHTDFPSPSLPVSKAKILTLARNLSEGSCDQCQTFFRSEEKFFKFLNSIERKHCSTFDHILHPYGSMQDPIISTVLTAYARSFDPYSQHLTPQNLSDLRIKMTGHYYGVGLLLERRLQDGFPKVKAILPGGPAHFSRALRAKDRILGLQHSESGGILSLKNSSLSDVVAILRNPSSPRIVLTLQGSDSNGKPHDVALTKAVVKLKSKETQFKEFMFENLSYLILKLPVLYPLADCEGFENYCIPKIKKRILKNKKNYSGIILDLRSNFGGDLKSAIELASLFIGEKIAGFISKNKNPKVYSKQLFATSTESTVVNLPTVILVDKNTASAAEVIAGALKHHKAAYILGETTRKKGAMQTIFEFMDDRGDKQTGGFKITTAQILLPSGESISQKGVVPHGPLKRNLGSDEYDDQGVVRAARTWVNQEGS